MIKHNQPNPKYPERIVVLGASGFVGSHLTAHLKEQGIKVKGFSSKDIDLCSRESISVLQGIVQESDAVVLVSAITPDRGRDNSTLMKNLSMVDNFCQFLDHSTCSHVVYISSDAVYDDNENPVREASHCNPSSLHGTMHLARERMLSLSMQAVQIPLMVLRPSLLYGLNDTHNGYGPNRFLRTSIQEGKITLFGNGEEKRDHVFIKDVSRMVGLCLAHRSEGILNVATGRSASFFDVAERVRALLNKPVKITCLTRQVPVTHRHFDITEGLKVFPSFQYTALETGLSESLGH